jgi:predicted XRE-type DNA-binding protein
MSKTNIETYASVRDAIADTPEEASNLRLRSELMDKIAAALVRRLHVDLEAV